MALAVVKGEREDSCSFNKSSRDSVLHSVLRIAVQVCAAATPRSPLYIYMPVVLWVVLHKYHSATYIPYYKHITGITSI